MDKSEQEIKELTEKKYRKNLILFLAMVLTVFLGAAVLVIYVDPFFHYHKPLEDFPYLVDNQLSQNPGMAKHMEYDSVILGSSMTVNFNTDWFAQLLGLNTVKLSYSGAFPKDQANIMEHIFNGDHQVRNVFLGIDVITYTGGIDETKYDIPAYLYDDNYFNDVYYVLSKDVILNYILRPAADPDKTDLATVYASWWTEEYYNEQWVLHNYEAPQKRDTTLERKVFIPAVRQNLKVNICPYIEANPDTEFIIFFPPYSILYWNDVILEGHLEASMLVYEYIAETLLAYDNVRVFFFPDIEEIVCDLNNYADYSHYHPDFNRYMTECFASGENEVFLTHHTIKERLSHMRSVIEAFDFEALLSQEQ